MTKQKRAKDYGISIGDLPKGRLNKITDVKGIRVGHCTIDTETSKTGVTVIIPSEDNIFTNKLTAASYVLNGFGKSLGLIQVDELGSLESVIALTNTLNIGLVHDAVVEYMIGECKRENVRVESINPLIFECNDAYLNDIQLRAVNREHVFKAIAAARSDFEEGDIGAGKGMSCHHLKGGIGSASRIVALDGQEFTVGVLVLSNHGRLKDLTINGKKLGEEISKAIEAKSHEDKGSVISIIATDMPLDSRQLGRVCKRAGVGLARLGSYIGHGSGEIMLAFSTANVLRNSGDNDFFEVKLLREDKLDAVFRAVAECEEEAVINSMVTAGRVTGYEGRTREALGDYLHLL